MVICVGLDEPIEGQGAKVDLVTRAKLYVGISRAQFMVMVVNCHVPGGWLEFWPSWNSRKANSKKHLDVRRFERMQLWKL